MTAPRLQRMTAEIEGEFVVFIIGMRINRPWKAHRWVPVFRSMGRMLKELHAAPELGFLGYTMTWLPVVLIQYWRSFEQLEAYARSRDGQHWPAWVDFNRRIGYANGDVGIWHETYRVAPGQYETVYDNMPPCGLGKAATLVPVAGRSETAGGRMGPRQEA